MSPEPASPGAERELGEVTIDARFEGPPASGNGGYVGGLLAQAFADPGALASGVRVRLLAPPPVETRLALVAIGRAGDGHGSGGEELIELRHGDAPLARAVRDPIAFDVPEPIAFETAHEASRGFRGFASHPIPRCFVCGPERGERDGLRIFPGLLGDRSGFGAVFASPWQPDTSLADADGERVDARFAWAALDCPGCFAFPQPDGLVLLGELTVALAGPVAIGERCVLLSWALSHEGRKHRTASALYGADGSCRGRAIGTWIELAPKA